MHTIPSLDEGAEWMHSLRGVDIVVHTAARAHILRGEVANALACYRAVNTAGSVNLAQQAAKAGVRRFVFLSSIGVHGDRQRHPFSEADNPSPHSPYALSKWEAEKALWQTAQQTGMDLVIIRPPLVYGPNAPGNFGRLLSLVHSGWPLPLASVHNCRSFIGLDNLVNFIEWCCVQPAAANQTFVISDGEDISTPGLIRQMAQAMDRPARLLPMPVCLLRAAAALVGRSAVLQQLAGDLVIDSSKARRLGWTPQVPLAEGIRRAVKPAPTALLHHDETPF